MAVVMRLSRGGAKKRPYYRIVVADKRSPRDGKYLERIGSYNPLLPKDHEDRVKVDTERAKHWLDLGAIPSDRVARFLDAEGLMKREARNNPNKGEPGANAKARLEEKAEKEAARKEAEEAAKAEAEAAPAEEEAPAEEAAAEEASAEEAPAEEAAAEDAPAAEAPAEEAPAEEAAAEGAPAEDAEEAKSE